ncbi:MAG: ATP-binding protein [Oscillatoriaceae cyanobacterium Prado104]|jgi:hypothetical protein|nr:ATP-binding protein [Oscillatoriaceae cyanobacterium Prado104]
MDWQEFLKVEAGKHELTTEQTETLLVALFSAEKAPLTLVKLSDRLTTSEITVKKRLENIYKKFSDSFSELAQAKGAGKLKNLHTKLKKQYYQKLESVVVAPDSNLSCYPEEFRYLIVEKNKMFYGRQFVFEAFDEFMRTYAKGYFILEGYAGMGKTSVAAKYVYDNPEVICYFFAGSQNKPEQFFNSIRRQIINRYDLHDSEEDNLPSLLSKVGNSTKFRGRLVIVVDDLDEVDRYTARGQNILYLPKTLPDGIYFFLTRQPSNLKNNHYNIHKTFLNTELGTKVYKFNLNATNYIDCNAIDIKKYLLSYVNSCNNQIHKQINYWIKDYNISMEKIIDRLCQRSENNFRCLNYLIQAIFDEVYNEPVFNKLPPAMIDDYQTHWVGMGMQNHEDKSRQILLYILVYDNGCKIPIDKLHEIADEEECYIESVLHDWLKYLRQKTKSDKEYYTLYNASFMEFIQSQHMMKSNRAIFKTVNHRINEYLISS